MATKINERLTKSYVDNAMDSARQYSETLFGRAEGRVKVILDDMIGKKLKDALATIRPVPTLTESVKQVTLRDANQGMLELAKNSFEKFGTAYTKHSGLKIRHVVYNVDGSATITVTN